MSGNTPRNVNPSAFLFDKDGTLFDFHATWNVWAGGLIAELAEDCAERAGALADAMHYDLESQRFRPTSPVIAGTNREAAECVAQALPERDIDEIEHHLMISSSKAPLAPAVPLAGFLAELSGRGMALGVMTNDTEYGARTHLEAAGVAGQFDFIAGFDSGYGAKPAPDPLLAFARAMDMDPAAVVMVGDSTHDLIAGRAAGMQTIGVLTGLAPTEELAPYADVVLPDIGHIPVWLDR